VIRADGVSIRLGEFTLTDVSFEVGTGEYFVILGPTGSGKTVLVECIVGLHQPSHGRIILEDRDVTNLLPEKRGVAYVPQDYCLFPHMTVEQNIGFGLRIRRADSAHITRQVRRLSEILQITHLLRRRPVNLSGGEKQRTALARALAVEPTLLLLDEPFAAVDERTREMLCDQFKVVQRELGTTTVHVSHNFEEALSVADRIGIFERGRLVQVGTPDEVFLRPASEFVAHFTGARNVIDGEVVRRDGGFAFRGCGVTVPVAATREGPAKLVVRPEELRIVTRLASGGPTLQGTVARVSDRGASVRVGITVAGGEWSLLVPKREARGLGLAMGQTVSFEIPSEALHLICQADPSADAALPQAAERGDHAALPRG